MKFYTIKALLLITMFLNLKSCDYHGEKYDLKQTIEKGRLANIPQNKMYFLSVDSLIKLKGKKISLQNYGIKILNSEFQILKTRSGECSIANLNKVSDLDELEINDLSDKTFIGLYPNIENIVASKKYSILCFWSTFYRKKLLKENVKFAEDAKSKNSDCQILYLNADIYSELFKKLYNTK